MTLSDVHVELFQIREEFVSFYILSVQRIDTINCRFANERKSAKKTQKNLIYRKASIEIAMMLLAIIANHHFTITFTLVEINHA